MVKQYDCRTNIEKTIKTIDSNNLKLSIDMSNIQDNVLLDNIESL